MDRGRALGSLFGLAVGDALGTTNEFKTMSAPPFPALAEGPVDDVVGGGPFSLPAGGVTDDTQMAAALAASVAERGGGVIDVADIAARYVAWRDVAFDVGVQIGQALDLVVAGVPATESGRRVWEERQRFPAGNGALMRTGVLGVLLAPSPDARREASFADAVITHFDPKCQLASAAFNASIACAVLAATAPSPRQLALAAETELALAADALRTRHADLGAEIDAAHAALTADLAHARDDDPDLYGAEVNLQRSAGFVRVAFRLAYWELLHAPTFTAAIIDVANRGGDADTNAAIVGALWGAYAGAGAIPSAWIDRTLRAPGLDGARGELHPRVLVDALARVHGISFRE
ncbi:MAG TPA: ADP-ribosylglycohydrolase family protein [Kofleriaceae bacterium]|nr:ADP-ribosylglycohydrolase family protein [Kofleriaceae bacterium]